MLTNSISNSTKTLSLNNLSNDQKQSFFLEAVSIIGGNNPNQEEKEKTINFCRIAYPLMDGFLVKGVEEWMEILSKELGEHIDLSQEKIRQLVILRILQVALEIKICYSENEQT